MSNHTSRTMVVSMRLWAGLPDWRFQGQILEIWPFFEVVWQWKTVFGSYIASMPIFMGLFKNFKTVNNWQIWPFFRLFGLI